MVQIREADEHDRQQIYRLRHAVYATELAQHRENPEQELHDPLDQFNQYFVASRDGEVLGFVSITPPDRGVFSLDKYFARDEVPFPRDDHLYEVRLLTVLKPYRHTPLAGLLMHAALRWITVRGGNRIAAIGRREVLPLYRKLGLVTTGRQTKSGAVIYELMSVSVARAEQHAWRHVRALRRALEHVDWKLDVPPLAPAGCLHGGAFFEAIGTDFASLQRRGAVINADVLDAWFPPSPHVLQVLHEHLPWLVKTSPPTACDGLLRAIANVRGIAPECLVPAAGSSALIFLAFRHWLGPESQVLILDPTYGEYSHILERIIGCRVDRLRLSQAEGYRLDPDRLAARLRRAYDLVVLVHPNNPTGRHLPRAEMETLLRHAPKSTRFWIDEAYIDYVGTSQSLEAFAAANANVVVCKSMSKVYALSGMRVAYLCASPAVAQELVTLTPPWAVSLPGQVAGVAALHDPVYYADCYRQTHALREALADGIRRAGPVQVHDGAANFLLCLLPPDGPDAATFVERCRKQGLFVRDIASMTVQPETHAFRIAVKDAETNRQMLDILAQSLRW